MVCSLQFSNTINSAMSMYKTLFNTMKKQQSQLPVTMILQKVKKRNQATLGANTTLPPDSPEEITPLPVVPEGESCLNSRKYYNIIKFKCFYFIITTYYYIFTVLINKTAC